MTTNEKMDILEAVMLNSDLPLLDCPLKHYFIGGMYLRIIYAPKGLQAVTMLHKTNHPFFLMKGKIKVYSDNEGVQELEAPYVNCTQQGTRRYIEILEDVVFCTVHRTDVVPESGSEEDIDKAVDKVMFEIMDLRENDFMGGVLKNNEIIDVKELQHEN